MSQDFGQQQSEIRPRLEQPEKVHSARQSLDDIAEAVERSLGIARGGNRLEQTREHRFERLLGRGRAQRPGFAGPPLGNMARGYLRLVEAEPAQLLAEDIGIVREVSIVFGRKGVEYLSGAFDLRSEQCEQA